MLVLISGSPVNAFLLAKSGDCVFSSKAVLIAGLLNTVKMISKSFCLLELSLPDLPALFSGTNYVRTVVR